MSIVVLEAATLGEGWLRTSRAILDDGDTAAYDGQATRELSRLTLAVERPRSDDPVIAHVYEPEWALMTDLAAGAGLATGR